MTEPTSTSAVRDAAELIAAAEELFAIAPSPIEVALHIGNIADAAKALRANHLADALSHVRYRADRVAENRHTGWLLSDPVAFDAKVDSIGSRWDGLPESEAIARNALEGAAEALRLTAEYVGADGMPAFEGGSWWDELCHARAVLGWDRLPDDWRTAPQDSAGTTEAAARAERHAAAVDDLVGDPEPSPDPEELRARVHGDDG